MSSFLQYAWAKRDKWWDKRDVAAAMAGRQLVRTQYRFAGKLATLARGLAPSRTDVQPLKKTSNPFIEYEIGRLGLRPAPIATTMRESYAQCNDDIIVEAFLRARLSMTGRSMSSVRYLEIGGNHPVQTSSTYLLYRAWGARGYIVEANAGLAERLRAVRPGDQVIQTAVSNKSDKTLSFHVHELDELSSLSPESIVDPSAVGMKGKIARVETVPNLHINDFFDAHIREPLDFMSIDIEGLDLPVLQALAPAHRPAVLQVECMDSFLLAQLRQTLEPRGYRLAAITDVNAIFVQD
jgi:FkbM family methyltransferase